MTPKEIKNRAKLLFNELAKKGLRYWLTVLVLLVGGTVIGDILGEQYMWIRLRYRIYPYLQAATPGEKYPSRTFLNLIDDDDYWKGKLARRVPLKRDYLACLVQALDSASPSLIALDVDLRSPIPQQSTE